MRRTHFECDRCGESLAMDCETEDDYPGGWLQLAQFDSNGTLDPIFHFCVPCTDAFSVWRNAQSAEENVRAEKE